MGRRTKTKRARMSFSRETTFDATPERLAKGDASEFINPAIIDSSEQRMGRVRRFSRESTLDRWHKSKMITQRQFTAGEEYRTLHERAMALPRVVASYGERTSAGECDYGLARTIAQARARSRWRAARNAIPRDMIGFVDRFLIADALPKYRGRAHMRSIAEMRNALDQLAEHFAHPC